MKKILLVILVIPVCFQSCALREDAETRFSDNWIDLQSIQNARQLGGYPTKNKRVLKQNMILRTGELASLSNDDKNLLVNTYRLVHIIDLRDEVEVADNPDPVIEGVQYHNLIVWPREVRIRLIQESTIAYGLDTDLYIQNYYTAFALEPAAIKAYKKMFDVLLKNETGSVLIRKRIKKVWRTIIMSATLLTLQEWKVNKKELWKANKKE